MALEKIEQAGLVPILKTIITWILIEYADKELFIF